MRPLLLALVVLSAQGILAWDTGDWNDKWWKQDKAPIKHKHHKHKHHKHYRHHHHRKQLCEPVVTTTLFTTATSTTSGPTGPSITTIPKVPPNIAGNLTSTGADCGNNLVTRAYGRFNAIFFGNFLTTEAHEIVGPLAVGGAFSGHAYNVNTQHGSDCSNVNNSFAGYALVVGKNDPAYRYSDIHVHGAVFLPNNSNTGNIQELDQGCPVYNDRGTGMMNFDLIKGNAITASEAFALMEPTLHLSSDGTLTRIGTSTTGFDVITFGTCKTCSYNDTFSSPDAIFYGIGNWNGPMGMSWPGRLIINLPVVMDTTIKIQGNQPSLGMRVCSTLWNFYASGESGNFQTGPFQVDRATGGRIGGFFLIPQGDIIDENRGAFAGQVIANNYYWIDSGIEILDYIAAGGNCITTDICIPVYTDDEDEDLPVVGDPESSSDSSSSESSTESSSSEESSSDDSNSSNNSEESSSQESNTSTENASSSSSSQESNTSTENASSSSGSQESNTSTENASSSSSSQESNTSTENASSSSSSSTSLPGDGYGGVSSSYDPSSTNEQSSSTVSSQINSNSESSSANTSSTLGESSIFESTSQSSEISSGLDSSSDLTFESSDGSTNSNPSNTISSGTISLSTISSSTISSGTVPSSTIPSSISISPSGQGDSEFSSTTDCPTETSTECHTHHHHVTTTQYQCDQGFIHDEEILACEHDNHHHHRKDYYAGDDDDNFENDVEFGLYDYNRFDEECDIDHGVVNYDKEGYEYKHHDNDEDHDHDDNEDEDEDEEDDNEEDDNEDEDEEDENKDENDDEDEDKDEEDDK